MNVVVDKRKKVIQIGFRLKNSTGWALRYHVNSISAAVEGKTVMSAGSVNRGGVVLKGDTTTFFFAPIPHTVGKKDVKAEAAIVYQYGLAEAGSLLLRETEYRVDLTISPDSHNYLIVSKNDAEI